MELDREFAIPCSISPCVIHIQRNNIETRKTKRFLAKPRTAECGNSQLIARTPRVGEVMVALMGVIDRRTRSYCLGQRCSSCKSLPRTAPDLPFTSCVAESQFARCFRALPPTNSSFTVIRDIIFGVVVVVVFIFITVPVSAQYRMSVQHRTPSVVASQPPPKKG